jgi:hypothetical protein
MHLSDVHMKGAEGELASMTPEEACYVIGQIVMSGELKNVDRVMRLADEAHVLTGSGFRHNLWFIEGDEMSLMPRKGVGFMSRGYALAYWMGMGSPPGVEIRMIVNPQAEATAVFDALEEMKTSAEDETPKLRLIRGGLDDAIEGGEVAEPDGLGQDSPAGD